MRQLLLIFFVLIFGNLTAWSQDHYEAQKALSSEELFIKQGGSNRVIANPGQKYLVLDASPTIGGFHRYRFFPGDNIKFRMHNETIRFNETIASVSDSSFTIGILNEAVGRMDYQEILLKDIRLMKVSRRIPFISQLAPILPLAGLLFVGADFFNRGVDGKRFTTDTASLVVGGSMVVAGYICYRLTFSSLKINGRNKLKVLETY
ncbi:hypothetical protein DYBT9623_02251 [Dyadobacter sp. CECT 9623]|jgi:hypothetical protein|uniref:Uncharacterized protein n=1 Tax=Dyadobacter linearis TaxID=2823330 RepID=A0ABN7RAW6_9BACT|nr:MULTISPECIES: hypothetical protein [unclassified Dyadobacter]MCE7059008.1 hypothetical protein [Dyadobacter sp. CY343]CAG5069515.1 hypothetical protein DYBT9623_02251 [Dyadobacter sp. CECT 9623]